MPHAPATLHQLHLLLVDLHDPAVRVGIAFVANDKTIGKRRYLEVIPDTGHGSALRNNVFKVLQQIENLLFAEGVRIFAFNPGNLTGQPVVHVFGCQFEQLVIAVLQGVFVDPYIGRQRIAFEIGSSFPLRFVIRICL